MQHYLAPLLNPQTVALVGASDRAGSLGRTVFENLLAGGFTGEIFAVNPNHRRLFGRRSYASVGAIGRAIDLTVVAAPPANVPKILGEERAKMRTVVLLSSPDSPDPAKSRAWLREVTEISRKRGIRIVGPGAFGVIRTDSGLNATFCAPPARRGKLALVAQSGAVCTAMLDFAGPMQIGFSTVVSLGGGIDVDFGELLDALVLDPLTDGILLYLETVGDARTFLSALRAAARTKPVIVLKAGRSLERLRASDEVGEPEVSPDVVFDAALMRAGTVRVHSYTQLFAAARILAMGRIPSGDRLAIVANGRGPGLLAADSTADAGVTLARFSKETVAALDAQLPPETARANPVDVRADAPPARFAAAVATALADPGTDAVLAIHVPRPIIGGIDAARAMAEAARGSVKPVLAAWLGAVNREDVHAALEAGGVANFFTPENAVHAFSFLAAYRRNQEWLLEVPPSQPEPAPPDLDTAESIRVRAASHRGGVLSIAETHKLLDAFGIATVPRVVVATLAEAQAAARRMRYPVTLSLDTSLPGSHRAGLPNGRAVARAHGQLLELARTMPEGEWNGAFVVGRATPAGVTGAAAVVLETDAVFGPVIAAGTSMRGRPGPLFRAVMLPPLNRRLATDLLAQAGQASAPAELVDLLLRVSSIACALPWVRSLALDPITLTDGGIAITDARVAVDPRRVSQQGYRHMAIHPYPAELDSSLALPDGTVLVMRPVRPEDAELERHFVRGLSEQSRFFRFFYRLNELTDVMLARFTQIDYDRELALVVIAPDKDGIGGEAIVGIARYVANVDEESAEFAIVVADAWQKRGVGTGLMQALIDNARRRGLARLTGTVLRVNQRMLRFVQALGFSVRDDSEDPEQVVAELRLR